MEITRETDYAIRCVYYLTRNRDRVSMVDEIARSMSIPKSFLAKIVQKLAKVGIVKSFRGMKGGFQLAKDPIKLNLYDVIEAIQGEVFINRCAVDNKFCSRRTRCAVHPVWKTIGQRLMEHLKEYNFELLSHAER
ncbi:MAG: Rrf2 family transcriptional regulator [Nitrospirota bacterium]